MSYTLTEEQQLIQENAKQFAAEYLAPFSTAIDRTHGISKSIIDKLAENDFFGLFIPEQYKGAGSDYLSYTLTVEQLSKASGSVAAALINHCSLVSAMILRWGTDSQKEKWLPALCKAEKLGAFALHEPDGAPGCGASKVIAIKDGSNYVLNCHKSYVAIVGEELLYIIFALTNPEAGIKGMSAFIVESDTPGLKIERSIQTMGLRGCTKIELSLTDVKVPASSLLGVENKGTLIVEDALALAGIAQGALVSGMTQGALEHAIEYAKQRIQFGHPIAVLPAVQNMLADIKLNAHLLHLAVSMAASLVSEGKPFGMEAALVRLYASRIGQASLMDAIQVEGGYGYSEEMPLARMFRDIKGAIIVDNTMELPSAKIAADLLA